MSSIAELCNTIVEIQVNPPFGCSLKDDTVESGKLHPGAKDSIGVRDTETVAQRTFCGYPIQSGARRPGAGKRPCEPDYAIPGVIPFDVRGYLIVYHLSPQARTTDELSQYSLIHLFLGDQLFGEVHPQHLAHVTTQFSH